MVIALLLVGCGGGGSTTPPAATTNEATTTTENVETTNTTSEITTTTANESQSFDAPTIDAETKQSYLDVINAVRAVEQDCGSEGIKTAVSTLEWNDSLYKAAYEHSEDLAESDTFSHDGSGTDTDWTSQVQNLGRGSTTKERIENNGYTNWRAIGENTTAGTSWDTAEEAVSEEDTAAEETEDDVEADVEPTPEIEEEEPSEDSEAEQEVQAESESEE